jgi:methylenetetrahydrofolate reductase (NADPH)
MRRNMFNRALAHASSSSSSSAAAAAAALLLRRMRYEIIPLPSASNCIPPLPPASLVSVTCSPSRGVPATQRLCESLIAKGHTPIPHLAARCVDGPSHASELADWVRACGIKQVFIVGGDAPRAAHESYTHALPFMSDFLSAKVHPPSPSAVPPLTMCNPHPPLLPLPQPQVTHVSFAAHPDAHPHASAPLLAQALLSKQSLLASHGISGSAVTQMCFDPQVVRDWISCSRATGFVLPIILGIPGPVPLHKLLAVAARVGVGESMRLVGKGGGGVMMGVAAAAVGVGRGRYDAGSVVRQLCEGGGGGTVQGLHCFTFNAVADAVAWADAAAKQLHAPSRSP